MSKFVNRRYNILGIEVTVHISSELEAILEADSDARHAFDAAVEKIMLKSDNVVVANVRGKSLVLTRQPTIINVSQQV